MRRTLCAMLAVTLATANLLTGCAMVPGATATQPFTLSYATNASNVDFFLNNDDFDTIAMSGPFYPGSRQLPSQNTGAFDAARANRVAATVAEAQKVVDGLDAVQPKMAALRTSYVTWLDVVSKQEPKAADFVKQTLNDVALLGTQELLGEAEYQGLAGQSATKAFATAMQQQLIVAKANELAALYLQEANDIAAYAALGLQAFAGSADPKITSANAELDKAMGTQLDDALKGLEPVAESVGVIDLGMKRLAAGDYLFAKAGSEWTTAEMAKLKPVVDGLQVRDGITAQDVADIKAYYQAFDEWKVSLDEHFAAMDASGITQAARPGGGTWQWGPELAWAADVGSSPNASYNQAVSTLNSDPAPKPGWLASGWGLVKSGFGKAKTVVGVGIDTLGSSVRTISAVGCGIYYGNSTKDIADNLGEGVKQVFDNYKNGTSGSSTIKTAKGYLEGTESGAGQAAGDFTKWAIGGVLGKGKVANGAGWVADGLLKNTVGMFTGLAKGIYKVADKSSSTADVAGGFIDITLSAIGGSRVIIKGSQVPGMLQSGFQGFKNAGAAVLSMADSAANKVAQGKLEAEIGRLMIAKGLTAAEAKELVSNQVRLEVQAAVGQMIDKSRDAMIQKVRDLIASGATARWTNFDKTIRDSLANLLSKSFDTSLQGFLDAGTTVLGSNYIDYIDKLIGRQLNPILADIINSALAVPPDPAQMNGSWAVTLVITKVDVPPGAQADAKKQGCDIDFSKLVGQKIPGTVAIAVDDGGSGSATFTGKGSAPSKGPATYAGGKITMSFTANKATISMQGNAALTKTGATMTGGFSMTAQGSPITMSGTWSGAKK